MNSPASVAPRWLWLVLGLALVRGGLYASLLPPWGLIDEEQHLHYVQYLVEERAIPIVGQVYLSPQIVESIVATRRWEIVLGQPVQLPPDPAQWGLEGHSYQAYHPPLYYLMLAPAYALLPDDILIKLAGLRWATVMLSVGAVWLTYRAAREAFPEEPWLALGAALLLVCLPERTAAVSRVNNDALLEAAGAAWLWAVAWVLRRGLTTRASQGLGVLLGLGILTKLSFVAVAIVLPGLWWRHRREGRLVGHIAWTAGLAAALVLPWLARNAGLYGDPTGYAAFRQLYALPQPGLSPMAIAHGLVTMWRTAWLVWWRGAQVGSRPLLEALYALWAVIFAAGQWGLARRWRRERASRGPLAAALAIIGAVAVLALISYFSAQVPGLQGRFLLAAMAAIALLLCAGFWRAPAGRWLWAAAVVLWLIADGLALFVNLLPMHYYYSAFLSGGRPPPDPLTQWPEAWAIFSSRLLSDKPAGVAWLAAGLLGAYPLLLAGVAALVRAAARQPAGANAPAPAEVSGATP